MKASLKSTLPARPAPAHFTARHSSLYKMTFFNLAIHWQLVTRAANLAKTGCALTSLAGPSVDLFGCHALARAARRLSRIALSSFSATKEKDRTPPRLALPGC